MRELERAVSLKPDDPVLNDHLGDAYWRAGRRLEATFQWSHARDMKPEPAVLAEVEKKLKEGLPPVENKAVARGAQGGACAGRRAAGRRSDRPAHRGRAGRQRRQAGRLQGDARASRCGRSPPTSSATASRYIEILNLNPQLQGDPGRLMPGQELTLPPASN